MEDQIESVADEDVPDLHSAIEYLQDQIDKITPPISGDTSVVPIERLVEQEDVKANINALNALVNGMMRSFHIPMTPVTLIIMSFVIRNASPS